MIPESLLTQLRKRETATMKDRVSLRRNVPVTPHSESPWVYATDVPARIKMGFGTFRDVADRFQGVTACNITVPETYDVRPGDEVLEGSDPENLTVYKVLDTRSSGTYRIAQRLLAELIH